MLKAVKLLAAISLLAASHSGRAQWTYVNLTSTSSSVAGCVATGVASGKQVGFYTDTFEIDHACLWSGTAGSLLDLNPSGSGGAEILGIAGTTQVGYAYIGGFQHAGKWTGTAASWLDLNPPGAGFSQATAAYGTQQVGSAAQGQIHAGLWNGTAASFIDLNPTNSTSSQALGITAGQQVGMARFSGVDQAGLWGGSAATWVSLHPAGAVSSYCTGTDSGQQVGQVLFGSAFHAGLWTGTAGSFIDLHPAAYTESFGQAVFSGRQAGYVVGATSRACFWSGSALSMIDLQTVLPAQFTNSHAYGIWDNGTTLYVVGDAFNNTTSKVNAIMWSGPLPTTVSPTVQTLAPGQVISGGLSDVLTGNDIRYVLRPGLVFSNSQRPIGLVLEGTAPAATALAVQLVVETQASGTSVNQRVEGYSFFAAAYVQLDSRNLATSDGRLVITVPKAGDYIGPSNVLRMRLSYASTAVTFAYPWLARIDEATWRFWR